MEMSIIQFCEIVCFFIGEIKNHLIYPISRASKITFFADYELAIWGERSPS